MKHLHVIRFSLRWSRSGRQITLFIPQAIHESRISFYSQTHGTFKLNGKFWWDFRPCKAKVSFEYLTKILEISQNLIFSLQKKIRILYSIFKSKMLSVSQCTCAGGITFISVGNRINRTWELNSLSPLSLWCVLEMLTRVAILLKTAS